ncbi:hypothetical protein D9611_009364 [Ephemerocybe angulata]|uniref:NYN domain-containing protein n=1 Tax=Ephemerocybe angulata TaxID=980116 RepID=A0A8H5F455_9AGAR|nr:hypothetical protein D9611_009364 [Tulosesus angulatus]
MEKGDVAVFWELSQTTSINGDPDLALEAIQEYAASHGPVKHKIAYLSGPNEPSRSARLNELGVQVKHCPKNGHKETVVHSMVVDVSFHCALDFPQTKTVVFVTGPDRDFTYLARVLRSQGKRIIILVMKNGKIAKVKKPDAYWPRPPLRTPDMKVNLQIHHPKHPPKQKKKDIRAKQVAQRH